MPSRPVRPPRSRQAPRAGTATFVALLASALCVIGTAPAVASTHYFPDIAERAVPKADCGPGSSPEKGLQGDVSAEDRASSRSTRGYHCNITRLGDLGGAGGGILSAAYDTCSYTGSLFPGNNFLKQPGVQVIDASNPRKPHITTSLTDIAMRGGTWETLKVNKKRKLLAGTSVPFLWGGGYLAIYDISDCAHPKLLNGRGPGIATPLPFTSHEGGFSPDGRTYWAAGLAPGHLTAIDISNPRNPRVIWQGLHSLVGHGFGITPDGNRMYLSNMAGITVLDISAIQRRAPFPQVPHVAAYLWPDGQVNQHSIPVTYGGRPHVITLDEAGSGGVKFFDVARVNKPKLINQVKLEINLPKNLDTNLRSSMGGSIFSSNPHYCVADRPADPTALACGWESSGIRVFDISTPKQVREIAYYNPPTIKSRNPFDLPNSAHALGSITGVPVIEFMSLGMAIANGRVRFDQMIGPRTGDVAFGDRAVDWCMSPPIFRGNQLFTTCADGGFQALEISADAYTPPANQDSTLG